jgi:hypothetical protein
MTQYAKWFIWRSIGVEKMEYADPELAAGNEPFYYRVR